jgi:hypothetical protein
MLLLEKPTRIRGSKIANISKKNVLSAKHTEKKEFVPTAGSPNNMYSTPEFYMLP